MSATELDTEQNIRTRAYLLWEAEGQLDWRPDDYWYRASERIEAEARPDYPPLQSLPHRS